MLSIHLIKLGHEDYYLDLLDYYLKQGKSPTWIGGLAEVFRLKGQAVERETFKRVLRGQHPWANQGKSTAEDPPPLPLVQNAGLPNRQAAWDLTFSAPKSISVIWSSANSEMAESIEALHLEAVEKTMAFAEEMFAYCRVGKGGTKIVPAKIMAARFLDVLSRAGDPNLHVHLLQFNLGYCEDGKFRSIISRPFYRNKILLGALFRAHDARLLYQKYGFSAERVGNSFAIKGVPQDLCDFRSTRRKQILAVMAELGTSGGKAAAMAALASRSSKKDLPPFKVLQERWLEEHDRLYGFNEKTIEALCTGVRDTTQFIPEVLARAAENIVKCQHHFTAYDFLREALFEAPAFAVSPEDLVPAVHKYLTESPDMIPIPMLYGEKRYTTAPVLEEELGLLEACRSMYELEGAVLSNEQVDFAIARAQANAHEKGYSLTEQQISAIRHLTQDKHSIRILQGYAGVGKTTATLRPTVQAFAAAGYNVIGAAYTNIAKQELADATGIQCSTLHSLLADFETDRLEVTKEYFKHTVRQLAREARGKKTRKYKGKPGPAKFDSKTIVLVDEAGMVGCHQVRVLLERLRKAGATVILTGDYAQIGAIEGTSPFYSLTQRMPHAEITDIRRQEDEWAREAAKHFAVGNVSAALDLYSKRGLLKTYDEEDAAIQALFHQWQHHSLHTPENSRILTTTNEQAHLLNLMAQKLRLEQSPASGIKSPHRSLPIEDTEKDVSFTSKVYVGDRVLFKKTAPRYGIFTSDIGTVVAFDGGHIVVELDRGTCVSVPVQGKKAYKRVRLGYASTTNAAQGKTIPIVFNLMTSPLMNMPSTYVQGSRSTKATHFFTTQQFYDELEGLEESLLVSLAGRRPDLSLAADLFTAPQEAIETPQQLYEKVLQNWKRVADDSPTLIITSTEEEEKHLNDQCHQLHLAAAQVDWERKKKAAQQERAAAEDKSSQPGETDNRESDELPSIEVQGKVLVGGERLRFPDGFRHQGLTKDVTATVTAVNPHTRTYEVEIDGRKRRKTIPIDDSEDIELAYAMHYPVSCRARVQRELGYAMLVNPQDFDDSPRPAYSTETDYFKWKPHQPEPVTTYSNPSQGYCGLDGTPLFPAAHTQTYQQTGPVQQHAAVWHQQVQQANQAAHWSVQQAQYLQQLGNVQQSQQTHREIRQFE